MLSRRALLAGLAATAACRRADGARSEGSATRSLDLDAWAPSPVPLPDDFHRGVNFAHLHRRGLGYGSDRALAQVRRLRADGVNALALNPFAYTRSLTTPDIQWGGDETLTDDDLARQADQIHGEGMRVLMKPHLWSWAFMSGSGNMDIRLDGPGWKEWFEKYTAYAVHYAEIAQRTGCESLCVGLEYTSASRENPGAWAAVAQACRQVYRGPLVYAANWYEEFEIFADWDAFDLIGVNAYFPLSAGDGSEADTTVDALTAAWKPHLDKIEAIAKGKPVIFPEAGYRAVAAATDRPWEEGKGGPDPALQARAYEALLRASTARPWFRGIYWWKWFTDLPGEGDPYVPADQPAERVMAQWFGATSPVGGR